MSETSIGSKMCECYNEIDEEKKKLIEEHLRLVIKANETMNLTRIDSFEDGMLLHVEDSLTALKEMNSAPGGLYGDLGSGAGYPGIPLGIATGRKTVLIDTRAKKMNTVKSMIETMGITGQIEVFAGRAELLARKMGGQFAVLTARALAKLAVLLELSSPLLKTGGHLICFKANVDDEEFNRALRLQNKLGMNLISDRSFVLEGGFNRRIIVFEKYGSAKIKLPRREGAAQKDPL